MSYDTLVKQAMAECGQDENEAKSYVKGFLKQAFMASPGGIMTNEAAKVVGKALSGALVGAGAYVAASALKGIGSSALHTKFLQALNQAIQSSHILQNADHNKVINYAETVFKFAPNVACDHNILASILTNAVHGDGVDPATVKMLGELEARYTDNHSTSMFNPKTYA